MIRKEVRNLNNLINSNSLDAAELHKFSAREIQNDEYAKDFADTVSNQLREAILLANENLIAALGKNSYCLVNSWLGVIQKLEDKLEAFSVRAVVLEMKNNRGA